jgi:hypothetical protein
MGGRLDSLHSRAREVSAERDASRARAATTRWDYFAQVSASSSHSERLKAFSQTLQECAALLGFRRRI